MKHTFRNCIVFLLAAVLLLPLGLFAAAKNGPYTPEDPDGWPYARLELVELDEKGKPVMVMVDDWEQQKTLPVYANGKITAREGAAYDKATNTLTLTDFNGAGYMLRVNLMGDDFTLCVKGTCTLGGIYVSGGGVMQPKWGGSLHITGDGALTVNALADSGISFWPQEEEETSFTVDPGVTLSVTGEPSALSVSSYNGTFKMTAGGKEVEVKKEPAMREMYIWLTGYSNPWEQYICLCRNAADPDGLYSMNEWFDENDNLVEVTVAHYIYTAKYDLYLEDFQWERQENGDSGLTFKTVAEAEAAGFTYLLDADGENRWQLISSMGNHHDENLYRDADGNNYVLGTGYDDNDEPFKIAQTPEPIEEIPGEYLFISAPDVDPESLTEATEYRAVEGMFDYVYPEKTFTSEPASGFLPGDVNNDGEVTAEDARFALRAAVGLDDTAEGLDFSDPQNLCYRAADVDGEPGITAGDARMILRAAVGLETLAA